MLHLLHTFNPQPILFSLGPLTVRYYGLFIVLGMMAAILIAIRLGKYYSIPKDKIIDLSFWLVLGGIIGTRTYHVFLELPYYLTNPLDVFKIWQGGLAIHGGIIAGIIVVYVFSKKNKLNFWQLTSIIVPGLSIALAAGRFGNYFNQELFGLPTDLPWGIPINIMNRPLEYISSEYFHPTFIYESIGSFTIFIGLILFHAWIIKNNRPSPAPNKTRETFNFQLLTCSYLIAYSILRFSLEFVRIDRTPKLIGLRWPQIASIIIVLACFSVLIYYKKKQIKQA